MGKSPMNVVVPLGVGEGQAGMAGTDRAPVVLCQTGASLPTVRALRSRDTRYPPLCTPAFACQGRCRAAPTRVFCAPWGEGAKRAASRALHPSSFSSTESGDTRSSRTAMRWGRPTCAPGRFGRVTVGARDDLARSSDRRPSSPVPAGLVSGSHA
jgi:hypothetical protein